MLGTGTGSPFHNVKAHLTTSIYIELVVNSRQHTPFIDKLLDFVVVIL